MRQDFQATRTPSRPSANPCWACTTPRNGPAIWTMRKMPNSCASSKSNMAASRPCMPRKGYDAAQLLEGAVRDVKGHIEDKTAFRKALRAANFKSVRCDFKFNKNHYPIHNIHM